MPVLTSIDIHIICADVSGSPIVSFIGVSLVKAGNMVGKFVNEYGDVDK